MKAKKILLAILFFCVINCFAQNAPSKIETKNGIHYITTSIDYPITGTYLFQGNLEPVVELNANGSGFYQLHEQPKRAIIWGIECDKSGESKFIKGFDSAAYTLWYQYTTSSDNDTDNDWKSVEFSIHFNTLKMYIQGERIKDYTETVEK